MQTASRLTALALLAAYPVAWAAPLAETGVLPWFGGSRLTVLGTLRDLWSVDRALALLVGLLAVAVPYLKVISTGLVLTGRLPDSLLPAIEIVGKLAMADVFLLALYIVIVKGVGIGHVTPDWGLWLFTACVAASMWTGHRAGRMARQRAGETRR